MVPQIIKTSLEFALGLGTMLLVISIQAIADFVCRILKH